MKYAYLFFKQLMYYGEFMIHSMLYYYTQMFFKRTKNPLVPILEFSVTNLQFGSCRTRFMVFMQQTLCNILESSAAGILSLPKIGVGVCLPSVWGGPLLCTFSVAMDAAILSGCFECQYGAQIDVSASRRLLSTLRISTTRRLPVSKRWFRFVDLAALERPWTGNIAV